VIFLGTLLVFGGSRRSTLAEEYRPSASTGESRGGYAISISSPVPGAVITTDHVVVRGRVRIPKKAEAIVLLGGHLSEDVEKAMKSSGRTLSDEEKLQFFAMTRQLAVVEGAQFAGIVGLHQGTNTITVSVGPISQPAATARVTVSVPAIDEKDRSILEAHPNKGPSPLHVTFDAPWLAPGSWNFDVDFDGDGTVDKHTQTLKDLTHSYDTAGLFFPIITAHSASGEVHKLTTLIHAFSPPDLISQWTAMKAVLRAGDVEGALRYIAWDSRSRFREVFRNLTVEPAKIDSVLTDLHVVKIGSDDADCEMLRTDNGRRRSYFVRFVRDYDGVWRVRTF